MHEFSKLSDHVNAIIDQNNSINYVIYIERWAKYYTTIWVILFHGNDLYHNIVIFALNKVFVISKLLIP